MATRSTDAELLRQARERPEALGEFYDRYESAVVAYFVRRCRDADVALELTAETFAEVVVVVQTSLAVDLGGERQTAVLSSTVLELRVPRDAPGLTAEGRRRRAQLPDTVRVRAFAAAFTPDRLNGVRTVQPHFRVELEGDRWGTTTGARFCVAQACGTSFPRVGG